MMASDTDLLRVLLVEDEVSLRGPLAEHLEKEGGYTVIQAAYAEEVRTLLSRVERPFDVALVDDLLAPDVGEDPEYLGIILMREIRSRWPETEVILFTGWGMERAIEALRAGAYRYLEKPVNLDELGMTIRMAMEQARLRQERDLLSAALEISNAMASPADADNVLRMIAEAVPRLTGADACVAVQVHPLTAKVRHVPDVPIGDVSVRWTRHLSQVPLTWRIVETGQTFCLDDADDRVQEMDAELYRSGVKSFIGVPIPARTRYLGVLYAYSLQPHVFGPHEEQVLTLLARQAGIALESARLFSQLSETEERLKGLIASSLDAVIAIDPDKRITVFNPRAEEMLGWTAGEMRDRSVARFHGDFSKAQEIHKVLDRGGTVAGWEVVLKHKDGTRVPALLSADLIRDSQGQAIGQVGFLRDLREVRLLEDRLRALIRVGQGITGTLELDEALNLIVESAVSVFPAAQKGSIHLYDERTGLLYISASCGYSPEIAQALTLKVGEGRAGWVYKHATPLVIGNVQQDARSRQVDQRIEHPEVREQKSAICVPLVVGDRVIGTLSLDNVTAFDAFNPKDLELLSLLASQAAIAIVNAELMTKNRERVRRLEMLSRASNEMMSNLRSLRLEDRLDLILGHAVQILNAEAGSILLVKRPGFLRLEASYGYRDDLQKSREFAIRSGKRTGLTGHIAYTGDLCNLHGEGLLSHWAVAGVESPHTLSGRCQSLLVIPLKRQKVGGEELIGLLRMENKQDKDGEIKSDIGFTEEDEWILSIFAKTVVICLENAELYEKTSDRLEDKVASLKAIQETGAAISAELDVDELLELIAEKAATVLEVPATSLMLWDDREENLLVKAKYGLTDEYTHQRVSRDKVDTAIALMGGLRPFYTPDLRTSPFGRLDLIEAEHLCSVLRVPLVASGGLIGILNVYSKDEPRQFASDEEEVAEVLASHAAITIRNARLYQAEQRRVKELFGLNTISQSIRSLTSIHEVYQQVNKSIARLVDAQMCAILLYDGAQEALICQLPMYGVPDEIGQRYRIPIGQSSLGGIIWETQEYLIINDVGQHPLVVEVGLKELADEAGLRDTLLVKLTAGNRNIGVVQASNKRDGTPFGDDDARLLCIFAAQAAAVIENARLYQELKRMYEELKRTNGLVAARTALAWMGMVSSEWKHRIGNQAQTIQEQIQLLRNDVRQLLGQQDRAALGSRLSLIERLAVQIQEKPIIPPLLAEEGVALIALNDLIGERTRQLWRNEPYREVDLCLDLQLCHAAIVRGSPEWLRRAFDILIDNAVEAVSGCPTRQIRVVTRESPGCGAEIIVSDTGTGIPPEVQARLFQQQIEKPDGVRGFGIGLLIAQAIVETYGGTIKVGHTGPTGTTMIMWLPLTARDGMDYRSHVS